MAVEDEELLTQQHGSDGREHGGDADGDDGGDGGGATIESILTSALHKCAARKLGKISKGKKSSKEETQEGSTVKKKKRKAGKESEAEGKVELAVLKGRGHESSGSSSSRKKEGETAITEARDGKKKDEEGSRSEEEEEEEEDIEAVSKTEVTSPTREYLKAVSVPKKKHSRKGNKAPQNNGRSLAITIHRADRLEGSLLLFPHPVVQVYICDVETGQLLPKSCAERKVTSYYESTELNHILPIMTRPFDVKKERSTYCRWEEELVFHEPPEHFTSDDPQVVVFFQLMDFPPSATSGLGIPETTGKDWVTFAWAFLKIRAANGHLNIGQQLRLQAWRPRRTSKVGLKDLHSWWRSGCRNKYPSTLYVTLQEVTIPLNPQPSLRSMLATQAEGGTADMAQCLDNSSPAGSSAALTVPQNKPAVQWSRKPYQSCRVGSSIKHRFPHSKKGCLVVKFSNDGLRIACGSHNEVLVYDVLSGQLEQVFRGHLGLIYDICWGSSDTHIVTASGDSTVRVWKVGGTETSNQSEVLAHPSYVYVSRFVPGSDVVVSGCFDHVIRVWTCSKKGPYSVVQEITNHLSFVNALCFNAEGDVMFSGDKQGMIFVWDVKLSTKDKSKKKSKILSLKHEAKVPDIVGNTINAITFHPGGYRLLVHTRDSQLRLVNHQQWTVTHSLRGALNIREQVRSCISPCGTFIVSGSEDRGLFVWNSDSGDIVTAVMNLPLCGTVSCVDFHPYDHMLAVCSYSSESPVLILVPGSNAATDSVSISLEASTSRNQYSSMRMSPQQAVLQGLDAYKTVTRTSVTVEKVHKIQEHNLLSGGTKNSSFCFSSQEKENSLFTMKIEDTKSGQRMMMAREDAILKKLDAVLKMASEEPLKMTSTTSTNREWSGGVLGEGHVATVLYDYTGSDKRELSLRQGDFVLVVQEMNSDWWLVQTADGRSTGLVPAPYLNKLTHNKQQTHAPMHSGKVLVVPSGQGDLTFLTDSEDPPLRPARARRHLSRSSTAQSIAATAQKNKESQRGTVQP